MPAIGPLTALIIAASHTEHALAVVIFLAIVRLVQDYVIYPRLVRHGMHLSTLAVILTVWAGAALAQAPGVMVAIPVAGFVSVSIRHWRMDREIERLVERAVCRRSSGRLPPARSQEARPRRGRSRPSSSALSASG